MTWLARRAWLAASRNPSILQFASRDRWALDGACAGVLFRRRVRWFPMGLHFGFYPVCIWAAASQPLLGGSRARGKSRSARGS
jgi:hypothetical protein